MVVMGDAALESSMMGTAGVVRVVAGANEMDIMGGAVVALDEAASDEDGTASWLARDV